ncbi:MAG: hypothetical protein MJ025_04045, partial [Victivallaceae bacterium]|nr:hypothetical protein [Victivallaceae bacterium]
MDKKTLLMIGSGEKSPDVLYATGFSSPDDIVCFVSGSRRAMLASPLEFDRARGDVTPGVEVLPDDEYGRDLMTRLLEIARRHAPNGFTVPRDFPVYWADRLREAGIEVTTVERPFPKREFKTMREIRMISNAELATQSAMMRARD